MHSKDTYKTSKTAFKKQLEINMEELNGRYPAHWAQLLNDVNYLTKHFEIKNFIDIGCGCGAVKKLMETHFPMLEYRGFDYSENAISIAKDKWQSENFFVKDCFEFQKEDFDKNDIVHMSALGDVLNNADELFEKFIKLDINFLLLYRVRITDKESFFEEEVAYGDVHTFAYYHNLEKLLGLIEKNGYSHKVRQNNSNSVNILIIKN